MAKIEDAIPFIPGPDDKCKECYGEGEIHDSECCGVPDKDEAGELVCCQIPLRHSYSCYCIARREEEHLEHLEQVEKELEEVLLGKDDGS